MNKTAMLAAAAAVLITAADIGKTAEVEVKLLSRGANGETMAFEPAFVKIAPTDTVRFIATVKGQSAEAFQGMLPEGATPIVGKTNGDIAVRFGHEGVYGVKCLPHYGICMVVMVSAPPRADHTNVGELASK